MSRDKKDFFRDDLLNTLKGLTRHYDIGYIFNNIHSLLHLNTPVKTRDVTNEQYFKNKRYSLKTQETAEYALYEFKEELLLRKALFTKIRETNPDFCMNMKEKISQKDYQNYITILKKSTQKLNTLIFNSTAKPHTNFKESMLRKEDELSAIIDSKESTMLSQIEDTFVLSELNSLDYLKLDQSTLEKIEKLKSTLEDRLQKAEFFNTLYSKGNTINITRSFNTERELID